MTTLLRSVIDASGLSRRKAFAAIREGRVGVDGRVAVDPSSEYSGGALTLDGEALTAAGGAKVYLLLNKPPNYITTVRDERGRPTVLDLVPAALRAPGLHPVGRLDRDTSGLLILTNDGDLTYGLTHPKHEVEKEYWLGLAARLEEAQVEALRRGVELDGQRRRPLALRRLEEREFQVSMVIREGRKRQVRRMLAAVGAKVTRLRRVREGGLLLGTLAEGGVRRLTEAEVEGLRASEGHGA